MFFVVKKRQIILLALLFVIIGVALSFAKTGPSKDEAMCLDFLKELGYHPSSSSKVSDVNIPEGFGKVYEEYNALQKEAGFDLVSYRGLTIKKYTFALSDDENLYANILIHEGKICGGDIVNPALDGYMLPLKFKETYHAS